MLVAVDIGNTNIHLGLFDLDSRRLINHFRVSASDTRLKDLSVDASILREASDCVLASVNPRAEDAFCNWLHPRWKGRLLRMPVDVPVNMPILVRNPDKIGTDRLLNALAAFQRTAAATIVIDAGTAVTIDAVSGKGEFIGGVIAPGLETLKEALHLRTAFLPRVSVQRPQRVLGRDTDEAVKSGLYWGTVGLVEKITKKLLEEQADTQAVLATGGDAELLANELQIIDEIIPHLTLEGMLTAYCRHFNSKDA